MANEDDNFPELAYFFLKLILNHVCVEDMMNIETMAAEAMRDFGSDEEVSDTEDPDLMAELQVNMATICNRKSADSHPRGDHSCLC